MIGLVLLRAVHCAHLCLCELPRSPEEAYQRVGTVFVAHVDSVIRGAPAGGDSAGAGRTWVAHVRVERAWKWGGRSAAPPARVAIRSQPWNFCDTAFGARERWLVFAFEDRDGGGLRSITCNGSSALGRWEGARFREDPGTAARLRWLTAHAPRPRRPAS